MAGAGTRFLPATKAVPKEMLPIIDKPIAQYNVEEVVKSGVKEIILVIQREALVTRNHFSNNNKYLERQLKIAGKKDQLKIIRDISRMAKFRYVYQEKRMGYGPAVPLKTAMRLINKDESFLYLYGDDMTIARTPVCQQLIDIYKKNLDIAGVVGAQKVAREAVDRYGIVKIKKGTRRQLEMMVEKPGIKEAPSELAVFGRFLFGPKILPIIKNLKPGKNGELWLTDAIDELARMEKVLVHEVEGKWLTTGDPLNYLKAMVEFVWQRDDLKEEFKKYIPSLHDKLWQIYNEAFASNKIDYNKLNRFFSLMPAISIDYAIMEKSALVYTIPSKIGWSDVGSWDSLYEIGSRDAEGNLNRGDVMAFDTSGSLLVGSGKMLAVTGMKDVIVVDAEDALLICPRGESQDVRKIVGRLDEEGRTEHLMHPTVQKPWGSYRVLEEGSGYLVKRITVDPGQKLSLQMHRHRSEHWVVVAGRALVTVGEETTVQEVNEKTFIPTQTRHRLENAGPESLNIIEVQLGDVISEDDIVRFEDIYGRIHDRR